LLTTAAASFLLTCASPAAPPARAFPAPEEWPAYRRDGSLQAHSPARGNLVSPRIVWRQFVGVLEGRVVLEPAPGQRRLVLPLAEVEPGSVPPGLAEQGFLPKSDLGDNELRSATTTYAHVLPGEPGPEKIEFESGFAKPTVNGQWQKCVGRCFARREGKWVQVWETQPIDMLFQPLPLVGDFDGDGRPEIAVLPFHELLLLDARTGAIKDRCRFTDTRSYGFFGAYDFAHDGRTEFLVQADFSKHVDVLGFRNGKLTLLWQRNVEADISNPRKILRVGPNPVADADGDGQSEVLTTIFNERGDQRWWVTVHEALTGRVKAELPDEYLAGLVDLEGRGVSQLLTVRVTGAGVPRFGTIRVYSLRGNRLTTLWQKEDAAWETWEPPLPANAQSTATFGRTTVMSWLGPQGVTVALQEANKRRTGLVTLSTGRWDGQGFQRVMSVGGRGLQAVGLDRSGRLLVRVDYPPGEAASLRVAGAKATLLGAKRVGGAPGPAVVAWPDGAKEPTIVVQGPGEEIVAFHPPGRDGRPGQLTRIAGRGQSTSWPETLGPVIADLAGDGRRALLLASASPGGSARLQALDLSGRALWHHDFPNIPGSKPVWNTGGIVLWQAGYFTDPRRQDVLVTIRRSMMHSEETGLLSGRDGRELWHRDRQISQRGVGGTPFALADYDGDGLEDVASLHPSILYLLKGNTGTDLLAKDATWKGVPAQPVYWGQPIAGDFLGTGRPALFFGGRSMTGLVRTDGSLVWWDALDQSAQDWPAFGNFTGQGRLEAMGAGYPDGIRCYDTATGRVLWRLPMPAPGSVIGSASADLNGDGRDEVVFVIGQQLVCLGAGRTPAEGSVLWRLPLPAQTGPPSFAALGRHEGLSILLVGTDGFVYAVR
jgi:outer membrane protein assembly factor BamB